MIKIVKIHSWGDYEKLIYESRLPVVVEVTSPLNGSYGMGIPAFTNILFSSVMYEHQLIFSSLSYQEWSKLLAKYIETPFDLPALLFYKNGKLVQVLSGLDVSLKEIQDYVDYLLAPSPLPPVYPGYVEKRAGSKIIRTYDDGKVETVLPNGTLLIKYPDNQKTETKYPDGRLKIEYSDGIISVQYPDGRLVITYPDGNVEEISVDGTHIVTYPNGSKLITRPDGTEELVMPTPTVDINLEDTSTEETETPTEETHTEETHTEDTPTEETPTAETPTGSDSQTDTDSDIIEAE